MHSERGEQSPVEHGARGCPEPDALWGPRAPPSAHTVQRVRADAVLRPTSPQLSPGENLILFSPICFSILMRFSEK